MENFENFSNYSPEVRNPLLGKSKLPFVTFELLLSYAKIFHKKSQVALKVNTQNSTNTVNSMTCCAVISHEIFHMYTYTHYGRKFQFVSVKNEKRKLKMKDEEVIDTSSLLVKVTVECH
jgi:hypothetical protein